ncbi:DUF3644 domain-containing protein [Candidatus Uhrbacteria bacterium]|nr:DUF3644 domain-containing protein [Candidatus Uhrbacteria bacterium]
MAKTSNQALSFTKTAISAAKLSIEMFNRVEPLHWKESVLMLNAHAWELLLKGSLLKKKQSIRESDGKTITAEKALNKVFHEQKLITKEEAKTIAQVISLRNEATHDLLPNIEDEIMAHLMYFSITSFNQLVKKEFRSLSGSFEKNYLSIALGNHTFYSNKVEKLFKYSRKKSTEQNRVLFLLDRGCEFVDNAANTQMKTKKLWDAKVKSLPRKSRVAMHLSVYDYINTQENVRLLPVHVARGYTASVDVHPSKNPNAPVVIKKTDPNKDFPHFTSDVARILEKDQSFIAKMARKLGIRQNEEYCYLHKLKKGENPKYSDKGLNYMKSYLETHPTFNPYK